MSRIFDLSSAYVVSKLGRSSKSNSEGLAGLMESEVSTEDAISSGEQWSRRKSSASLFGAYVLAFLFGAVLLAVPFGPIGPWIGVGGMVIAAPMFFVALAILLIFHASIRAHLALWCLAAPFVAPGLWASFRYLVSGPFDMSFVMFVARNVTSDGLLVFGFASLAAGLFYLFEAGAKLLKG